MLKYYLTPEARALGLRFDEPRIGDAGFDIRALTPTHIPHHSRATIRTGLYVAIPEGLVGLIRDRSSYAKEGLFTHGGVIDASYRGELKVLLSNNSGASVVVERGDRIAQLIVVPCMTRAVRIDSLQGLGTTARGDRGFGSTGR